MKREEGFYREGAEGAKFGGRDVKGYGGLGIWDWGTGGKRTMDGRGGRGWDAEDGGLMIVDF